MLNAISSGLIKFPEVASVPSPLAITMGEANNHDALATIGESSETITRFITTPNALGLSEGSESTPTITSPDDVLAQLANLQQAQSSIDSAKDITEIRQLMRRVIQAGTDNEILEILQIRDDQMPEAIKSLQRVLEKVNAKHPSMEEEIPPPGVVIGTVRRSVSVKADGPRRKSSGGLKRSKTMVSIESSISSSNSSGGSGSKNRDTLNQEFIETGISALMRLSKGRDVNLPSWTITKYEINREKQIGMGGFSKVYRGTWNGRTVAIKVLKMKVTKKLFVREVEIWKKLHHPNILELYGASSASEPPWFFVSPYMKNGNLVDYLRKVEGELRKIQTRPRSVSPAPSHHSGKERGSTMPLSGFKPKPELSPHRESTLPIPIKSTADGKIVVRREWDLFRFMLEVAKGMRYLHNEGVLHGDLKASNVLVDDDYRCVITDFGQSEIKSEAYRLSGESPPHRTFLPHLFMFLRLHFVRGDYALASPRDLGVGRRHDKGDRCLCLRCCLR